jgi:hypothetical protein
MPPFLNKVSPRSWRPYRERPMKFRQLKDEASLSRCMGIHALFTIRDAVWGHLRAANPDPTFQKTIMTVYKNDDRKFYEIVISDHRSYFVDQQTNQP